MTCLLPQRERYFKTALHAHTNVSDGFWSPEDLKAHYQELGFHCVAFSDHNVITTQSRLTDENFLALTAVEMGTREKDVHPFHARMVHINVLSKEPDHLWQAAKPEYLYPNSDPWLDQVHIEDRELECTVDSINDFIARSNAQGFLCTYNHPDDPGFWDNTDLEFKGLWGIEVYNNDSYNWGNPGYNDEKFQKLLMRGEKVFPIISDDCHSKKSARGFGLWVGARELSYEAMIEALVKGDFYSTTGPQIHSLTVDEENVLHVSCTEAVRIALQTHGHYSQCRPPHCLGGPITQTTIDLAPWLRNITDEWKDKAFFRLVITDAEGHRAYTRPYYLSDLA